MGSAIEPFIVPRSRESLAVAINDQQRFVAAVRNVAARYYNCDTRPLIWDGSSVQRIGPPAVPPEVLALLRSETATLARLQHEYSTLSRTPLTMT